MRGRRRRVVFLAKVLIIIIYLITTLLSWQKLKLGELRGAMGAGVMTLDDVHAELGQVVNGDKTGREGDELIVVDLTGTGAQDAAIGQVAWDKLSML